MSIHTFSPYSLLRCSLLFSSLRLFHILRLYIFIYIAFFRTISYTPFPPFFLPSIYLSSPLLLVPPFSSSYLFPSL